MRIIAGTLRGRRIEAPEGLDTRPILDRVKAPLFDWLGSRLALPGSLPPVNVCDLYCGPGTHGIEAISRGVAHCVFVDRNPAAAGCLRRNIDALDIASQATVLDQPIETVRFPEPNGAPFSIVFFDPPFSLSEDTTTDSPTMRVMTRLATSLPVTKDAFLTWRHDDHITLPTALPGGWTQIDRRVWRRNAITFYGQSDA
ncbi:MAG TPA: RsmD family RNA methyltransferase [Phycisphaerae bacterium]|mgnify:CR=1 FL=1|nr:RsmD family RNA methyltransferase [Phycisphaerae bacterium]HRW56113.1 RsmD family RNA methyltransferase [Phycisphaerae bacterium]